MHSQVCRRSCPSSNWLPCCYHSGDSHLQLGEHEVALCGSLTLHTQEQRRSVFSQAAHAKSCVRIFTSKCPNKFIVYADLPLWRFLWLFLGSHWCVCRPSLSILCSASMSKMHVSSLSGQYQPHLLEPPSVQTSMTRRLAGSE